MFTQDELRLIEHMARTYAAKKEKNIRSLTHDFGIMVDMDKIERMNVSRKMALTIKRKATEARLNMHKEAVSKNEEKIG